MPFSTSILIWAAARGPERIDDVATTANDLDGELLVRRRWGRGPEQVPEVGARPEGNDGGGQDQAGPAARLKGNDGVRLVGGGAAKVQRWVVWA